MIVPRRTGSFVEDMFTDIEACHTLKLGHQEDVWRDACSVDKTDYAPSVQLNNQTLDFLTDSLELDGVYCSVANEESSHERGMSLFIPIPKNVQSNTVPKLVVARNVLPNGRIKCAFVFLQNVMTTRLMMNGDEVVVRAGLFDETSPFVPALKAASSIP